MTHIPNTIFSEYKQTIAPVSSSRIIIHRQVQQIIIENGCVLYCIQTRRTVFCIIIILWNTNQLSIYVCFIFTPFDCCVHNFFTIHFNENTFWPLLWMKSESSWKINYISGRPTSKKMSVESIIYRLDNNDGKFFNLFPNHFADFFFFSNALHYTLVVEYIIIIS